MSPVRNGITTTAVEGWFIQHIAATVRMDAAEIDVDAPFVRYGLDSLDAVQLLGELEDWLECPVPEIRTLMQCHSISDAAERVVASLWQSSSVGSADLAS